MKAGSRIHGLNGIAEKYCAAILKCMSKMDLSWDFYRTFLAVLDEGSLSAAARELGLTQPTVGRHVDAMEAALGYPLFVRSPHGLLPTDAALALKPYAETLAATSAALLRAASGQRDTVRGTVRISASEVIGIEVLPPILTELHEAYPELTIELSASDTVEDLLRQEADIAVRMVAPAQDALIARHVGAVPLSFHAHRRYIERHGMPQTLTELSDHSLIGYDRETAAIRAIVAVASTESPPSARKSSVTPISVRSSTPPTMCTSAASRSVRGATDSGATSAASSAATAGSPLAISLSVERTDFSSVCV